MEWYDVAVIGAGPAGLFCAIHAAVPGCRIILLEKNRDPGTKLMLAGSGQCNITHDGDIRTFLSHYGDQGKLVKPALFEFTNRDLVVFFHKHGLKMQSEENGKVFPKTRRSADVLVLLLRECKERGVELRCGDGVTGIAQTAEGFTITTLTTTYRSTILVIATGGASYPETGSTGDGYRFAASLGQPVTGIAPALTPLIIRDYPFAALAGISFERMQFSVWRARKKIAFHTGDVLFTHRGFSGPGILDASRNIRPDDVIRISFAGTLQREEFTADLTKRVRENSTAQLRTILAAYPIPERLIRKLLELSGIPDELTCANLSAAQRSRLIANCTEFPLNVEAPGDFSVAMVTRGGISLDSVNMKTMESKIIPDLFFAGEVLDIDGDTGGYNLQAAFSTGFLAAKSIRKKMER